MRPKTTVIILN